MSESDGLESPKPQSSGRQQPEPLKCPRCESTNTKFCYFNNYNKTQPRHFCKACKRHWTAGGTLRSVPIGGGRKNKKLRRPTISTRNNPSKDQDSLVPPMSDPKDTSDVAKASFLKPIGSHERRYDVESYTDIEELKGLVSWDFNGSFIGCTVQSGQEDHQRLGFSKPLSSVETNPSSNIPSTSNFLELNNWNWSDLDTIILEDMNKPWEDPTFKT